MYNIGTQIQKISHGIKKDKQFIKTEKQKLKYQRQQITKEKEQHQTEKRKTKEDIQKLVEQYVNNNNKLENDKQEFELQKSKLSQEKEIFQIQQAKHQATVQKIKNVQGSEIFDLNVGGKTGISVSKELVTSVEGSLMYEFFSNNHRIRMKNGKIYIDRDHEIFKLVISQLRNRQIKIKVQDPMKKQLYQQEMKYWGLEDLVMSPLDRIKKNQKIYTVDETLTKLQRILDTEPNTKCKESLKTWNKLGRQDLGHLVDQDLVKINCNEIFQDNKQNGYVYHGQIKDLGIYEGYGRTIFDNGDIFEGDVKVKFNENETKKAKSYKDGYGREIKADGSYYEGFFKDNNFHGKGKKVTGKLIQEGIFEDDEFQN